MRSGTDLAAVPLRNAAGARDVDAEVTLTRQGRQNWRPVVSLVASAGRGRIILRRKVAVRLPSAARRILASSQFPYSAWSVRIRRATSLDVLRGKLSIRYEYSVITTYCARRWR